MHHDTHTTVELSIYSITFYFLDDSSMFNKWTSVVVRNFCNRQRHYMNNNHYIDWIIIDLQNYNNVYYIFIYIILGIIEAINLCVYLEVWLYVL